jgi:hypothetical protein
MNEFLFTPVAAMPLVIWIIAFEYYLFGYLPNWLWGFWFYRYLWQPDYMKEVIGEELYDKLS